MDLMHPWALGIGKGEVPILRQLTGEQLVGCLQILWG